MVYEFDGWYTTAQGIPGTKYTFTENDTMPDGDLYLYAIWRPITRYVNFYMDEADYLNGVTIPQRMTIKDENGNELFADTNPYKKEYAQREVPNGSAVSVKDLDDPGVTEGYEQYHPYNGYTFVGWFYHDAQGNEMAFDTDNMSVMRDLDLYAKWSSNTVVKINVDFLLDENNDGQPDVGADGKYIKVADSISQSALAGTTKTFEAKIEGDLYAAYSSGYYPMVSSHSFTVVNDDMEGTVYGRNYYYFLYDDVDKVP